MPDALVPYEDNRPGARAYEDAEKRAYIEWLFDHLMAKMLQGKRATVEQIIATEIHPNGMNPTKDIVRRWLSDERYFDLIQKWVKESRSIASQRIAAVWPDLIQDLIDSIMQSPHLMSKIKGIELLNNILLTLEGQVAPGQGRNSLALIINRFEQRTTQAVEKTPEVPEVIDVKPRLVSEK